MSSLSDCSIAVGRLKEDFGAFGGKHIDRNDCEGGITSMITLSDLDVDDEEESAPAPSTSEDLPPPLEGASTSAMEEID